MTPLYFASGVSAPADLRGFARIGHPLGVSLPALSAPAIRSRRWPACDAGHRSVRKVRRLGARVIVPIQRGALTAAAFDRACGEALGFTDYVRAIPGNKAAMPPAELERYLREARPAAVHVLGCGPRSPRFTALADVLRRLAPGAAISCDSNLIAAHVGRGNGPGGGPRLLTAIQHGGRSPWQDFGPKDRETAIIFAFGPGLWFQRMQASLAAQGIVIRGFERVDDGLEARGFELTKPRVVQLGLFDGQAGDDR